MPKPQQPATKLVSLYELGRYSLEWVKDFYNQAGVWWGPDPQEENVHAGRVKIIERLCGPGPHHILELGAGPGASAAALADAGHSVTAIELSPSRAEYARELAGIARPGKMKVLEGDFYTVELGERFDVICCWETFGIGSDADGRRLLKRMASEWLEPQGSILVDVYSPVRPMREAGTERHLPPLKGVPGSVEMINRCAFDPLHFRWIDEWQPVEEPDKAMAQSIRCYSPADFMLLLEGSPLVVRAMEVDGVPLEFASDSITVSGPLMEAWCYLAELVREDASPG